MGDVTARLLLREQLGAVGVSSLPSSSRCRIGQGEVRARSGRSTQGLSTVVVQPGPADRSKALAMNRCNGGSLEHQVG